MAGLNWLKVDVSIFDHPKTRRLARVLGISLEQTVGHLVRLWGWGFRLAPDGILKNADAFDVADAAHFDGDADTFLDALLTCSSSGVGFMERNEDGQLLFHDWNDYSGSLEVKREKERERKRKKTEERGTPSQETEVPKPSAGIPRNSAEKNGTARNSSLREEERREEKNREDKILKAGGAGQKTPDSAADPWIENKLDEIHHVVEAPKPAHLAELLAQWRETYGASFVARCITAALRWLQDNGRQYTDMGRFLGAWLARENKDNGGLDRAKGMTAEEELKADLEKCGLL